MYSKISEIPEADRWRVLSSDLNQFPSFITEDDYHKISDMINQIFKNVFDLDYSFADYMNYENFGYEKAVFDIDSKSNQQRKKISVFAEFNSASDNLNYRVNLNFAFTNIENKYVFGHCFFNVTDDGFLTKLPFKNQHGDNADCYSYFSENQCYDRTEIDYKHHIFNYKNNNLEFQGIPHLSYEYSIKEKSVDLKLDYSYILFSHVLELNLPKIDRSFTVNLFDINDVTMIRSQQLRKFFALYSENFAVSDFLDLDFKDVHNPEKFKSFIQNFFDDPFVEDKLTLIDMMTI